MMKVSPPSMPVAKAESNVWPWQPQDTSAMAAAGTEDFTWPRITIVTPSFNQAVYLEETIRSVLLQGYPNLEYIVIDGGSTDGSREILDKYTDWIDFWVSEPDRGQAHALNKGFARATGDWLTWLNSDDIFMPDTLWRIAMEIHANPGSNWFVGTVIVADEKLRPVRRFEPVCNTDDWLDFLCTKRTTGTSLPQPGSFWSRRAWESAGALDESLRYVMDYEYWARLARCGFRPLIITSDLAIFRLTESSKTGTGIDKFIQEEKLVVGRYLKDCDFKDVPGILLYKWFLRELRLYRIFKNSFRGKFFSMAGKVKRLFFRNRHI